MPKPLKKQFYFMSPVHVVKVTTHNIEQAAEWCGGEIKTTDSRRYPGRTDKYIEVPVPKGAALVMAFPGMYITKRIVISLENEIKVTFAVFRRDYFEKNYFLEPIQSIDACWTRLANEEMEPEQAIVAVNVANPGDVGKALMAAREKMTAPNATVDEVVEAAGEILDAVLTPAQQRMLITGDAVEAGTNPETGNVVLPRSAAGTVHPSLRGDVHDPFKVVEDVPLMEEAILEHADTGDDVLGILDGPVTDDTLTTAIDHEEEINRAASEVFGGPTTIGEQLDSPVVGSAANHRALLEIPRGSSFTEGRSEAQALADKAAYDAEMKANEEGDPHR